MLGIKISNVIGRFRRYREKIVPGKRMKYSPQQQQQDQKDRKSESETMSSVNATPARAAANALQRSASAASQSTTSAARRILTCRPISTDMFAWMRVFRLANLLNQVGC